jgi:predicted RNase H-like HicB family nuclease
MVNMIVKDLDYYLNLPYQIILTKGDAEGDGWLAEIPSYWGCISAGSTQEEALQMIEEARVLWISYRYEQGHPIPEPERLPAHD